MRKVIAYILTLAASLWASMPVWAEEVKTSIIGGGSVETGKNGEGIFYILNLILTIMTYGVGILATIGIVIAGYTYLTAKDDASKVAKAKERLVQIVIGLAIYAVIWSLLQFLLPGGLFGNGSD